MAAQGPFSVRTQPEIIRKKRILGQKDELEREVDTLQNMLSQEQKVKEVLERVRARKDGPTIGIPNFLPPKMKELLAELAMVDGEIARLEGHITQLKTSLKQEREVSDLPKPKQWQQGVLGNSFTRSLNLSNPNSVTKAAQVHDKTGFETKALHFISKAIKGDYNLSDSKAFTHQKDNNLHDEVVKVPRKGPLLKTASPLRDLRHPTPRPTRDRNVEFAFDVPPKPLSSTIQSDEMGQNWKPNKLSESIMQCLIFIYVRLLRTSRQMELDKSGPVSRSMNSSLSSRSFRVETSSAVKSNLASQKESRQQDPYGIFDTEDSVPRDIGPYKNLVIFTGTSLDPKCISSSSSIPLLRKLRLLTNNLHTMDLGSLTYQQKLAFWINMYNACIMHGFLQYGAPSSPEKLLNLMNKANLNIGGNVLNAPAIEHFILRKPQPSNKNEKGERDEKEAAIVAELYGVETVNPNIIFALCCGTRSSPAVKIYTADGVLAELEKSKLEYLQASILVTSAKRIAFPELLLRNMNDFAKDADSLLEWVCHQLPTSGTLRKSMVDCFRGQTSGRILTNIVEKLPYDFEFQYLLSM